MMKMRIIDKIKKEIYRVRDSWKNYPFFASFFIFGIVFLAYSSVYLNNQGISYLDDHFFHFKSAFVLRTQGWNAVNNPNWIYLKPIIPNLGRQYIFFQIAVIPFTYIKDMILGMKINDIFWASFSFSIFYYIFRKSKIKFSLLFLIILTSSDYMLMRMISGRSFILINSLFFLQIYLAVKNKYRKLFSLALFNVLWHPATYLFPIILVTLVEAGRYMEIKKIAWKNFIAAGMAIIIGMAFFSDYPKNIIKSIMAIASLLWGAHQSGFNVEGTEVYAKNPLQAFWSGSGLFFLLSLIGISLVIYYYILSKKDNFQEENKTKEDTEASVLMYAIFLFLIVSIAGSLIISGRFFDYYYPASVFLIAIVLNKLFKEEKIKINKSVGKYVICGVFIYFLGLAGSSLLNVRMSIYNNDYRPYAQVAEWVGSQSKNHERVFLENWSWFAVSFFYNDKNVYSSGLEPKSMLDANPSLYWKWYNMFSYNYYCSEEKDCKEEATQFLETYNKSSDDEKKEMNKENGREMASSVKNDFHSRFIISDSATFNNAILLNSEMIEDSFEVKSDINKTTVRAFKLK
jgi:hypothetical protein